MDEKKKDELSKAIMGAAMMDLMQQQPQDGLYTLMSCSLQVTDEALVLSVPQKMLHLVEPKDSQVRTAMQKAASASGVGDKPLVLRGF